MGRDQHFTVVEMCGTPYQMGRQHGSQCGPLIRDLIGRFDGLILTGPHVEAGRELARQAADCVREAAPDLFEEVQGIADGAGVAFDDVFRLNCSVELFAWQGCVESQSVNTVPGPADGCSSFAVDAAEGPLVAWNMDWWRLWQPYIVLLHGRPAHGPHFFAFAFAGCVGRPGMSERVAVAANYLPYRGGPAPGVPNAWDGPGVPYGFLVRMMLGQDSTAKAVAMVAKVRRMACLNYTIGDVTGDLRWLETTPTAHAESSLAGDFLTHANSYLHQDFDGLTGDRLATDDPRTHHAREQLRGAPRPLTRRILQAVQQSHFVGNTTGVCVHNRLQQHDGITLLAFIAELATGTLWVAYGPPCEHDFIAYHL